MPGKFLSEEAKKQMRDQQRKRKLVVSTATQWTIGLLIAAVILLNLFTHVLQVVRYNGQGMEPNLQSGQTLILLKTEEVSEGDVIAFYYNNQVLVRRVVCLGGKHISIEEDGTVYINSQALEEPYLENKSVGQCNTAFPYFIPSGYAFVMGDNREIAMDSRLEEIGPVPMGRIIGKVILTI